MNARGTTTSAAAAASAGASICKQWLVRLQQASVKFIRRFWDKGRRETRTRCKIKIKNPHGLTAGGGNKRFSNRLWRGATILETRRNTKADKQTNGICISCSGTMVRYRVNNGIDECPMISLYCCFFFTSQNFGLLLKWDLGSGKPNTKKPHAKYRKFKYKKQGNNSATS